ncbi:methyl-accepting chemotaxis protein [Chachezhania sediminis]|uniref:methyl-accepting chemotaxis protein n=1 Tax=Chachezhania sediminis TaxID=2599291 RepID=UPI00131EB5E8|nr:methyl-accepting chemotaxis protein [Chachezhania sediminis]
MPSLTISRKLLLLNLLAGLFMIAVVALETLEIRNTISENREDLVRSQTESAISIALGFAARAEAGEMTLAEAQERAIHAIGAIRYNSNDYIFLYTLDGTALAHPNPDMVGASLWELEDPNGKMVIQELIAAGQAGGGFVDYMWPRAGEDVPMAKVSYSSIVPGWNWMVGTGVYVDDLNALIRKEVIKSVILLVVVLLLLVGAGHLIARTITVPLNALAASIKRIREGAVDEDISTLGRRDEIGTIAEQTDALRLGLMEKRALEAQNAARETEQANVVARLASGLKSLAAGDLDSEIRESFSGGYDQLRQDFNETVGILATLIRAISLSAKDIRTAVGEIASASNDLSRRTENAAATLEETAAALSELTQSVAVSAQGASQANTLAKTAREKAERTETIVEETVEAMGQIEQSSLEIARIIDEIEDIAFQTNLLALNAGVEAARAGEAGSGFAVVASEVRALAQRASGSAREINKLISASGQHVNRGADLVRTAGDALHEIVQAVANMTDHVDGIARSAEEQSIGLREIDTSISQLDQATQENAAMFEETSAANSALDAEAGRLVQQVARFTVADDPDGVETRSAA